MTLFRFLLLFAAIGLGMLGWAYRTAVADPVVRRTDVALPGLGPGEDVTALLISDIHVAGPDMPPNRLARIVKQINALKPDVVLIAGDLVGDKDFGTHRYAMDEIVAPLAALRPKFGTFAVLGNHDYWRSGLQARAALRSVNVNVLDNDAAQAGPLAIGGLDDDFTGHADLTETLRRMARLNGARILLSHSPDPFPDVPANVVLMFAGHTHCGQIRLPLIGAITTESDYGDRYACGLVREGGKNLVVTAGLGTSVLPLRLGAVPDMWLVRMRPANGRAGPRG